MKIICAVMLLFAICAAAFSQIHVRVEPADTVKVIKPVVLDSAATAEAIKLYSIMQSAEWNMRDLQRRLFSDLPDANREDKVRQQIAESLIEEQTTLWDFQIERALKSKDKTLLKSLQTAFTELSNNKSAFQESVKQERKKIEKLLEDK